MDQSEKYSTTPFYVLCSLYVPFLKPNAPAKTDLTISNVSFVKRALPYVVAIQEQALDLYSTTFFEPGKVLATFIQITGRELKTGMSYQYDGALLLEVVEVYNSLDQLKSKISDALDL